MMDKKDIRQFLVVRLADEQYAIDLTHAVEIIDPRKAAVISDSISPLPTKFEYEKSRLPVIDLWRHLRNQEHDRKAGTILVITECGGEKAALVVNSAEEILRIDRNEAGQIAETSAGDLFEAHLNIDDRNIPVLNLTGIFKLSGVIV